MTKLPTHSVDSVLEFKDVFLNYGKISVLKKINFSLKAKEVVALVGPSGAGKSSLLMLAGGLEKASSGDILLDNNKYNGKSEDAITLLRREYIGIIFQAFHLNPALDAQENVAVPLELAGKKGALNKAKIILSSLSLGHRLKHYPSQLSGGEQQRVGIARAFISEPKLILADEPTGNLDKKTGSVVIKQLLNASKTNGCSVLLVTHDMNIADICSRVITLEEGKIVEL